MVDNVKCDATDYESLKTSHETTTNTMTINFVACKNTYSTHKKL